MRSIWAVYKRQNIGKVHRTISDIFLISNSHDLLAIVFAEFSNVVQSFNLKSKQKTVTPALYSSDITSGELNWNRKNLLFCNQGALWIFPFNKDLSYTDTQLTKEK